MGFLNGKRALIVGLATDRSIAWGIAQAMHREGAELAFAHIERMTDRVVPSPSNWDPISPLSWMSAAMRTFDKGFAYLKIPLAGLRHFGACRRLCLARSAHRRFFERHLARGL